MAFVTPAGLRGAPARRARRTCARARPPAMLEQATLVAAATVLLGVGGGIGLVAWTERQGKRTETRANAQPCTECRGETTTPCNVCNASGKDPLDPTKTCSYCDGKALIKCFNCAGSGVQPRFLDRLSPEDFMD